MVVICVHLLHVNTISISPAFGTCRLHVDPASSLRLQSAHGQFCALANWCQWPTALSAATLAQRLPKATPPEGQSAIITIPVEVVRTCQKNLARKRRVVTFDGKSKWLSQNVGYLVLWHSPHFRSKSTQLTASVPFHSPLFLTVLGFRGGYLSQQLFPQTVLTKISDDLKETRAKVKISGGPIAFCIRKPFPKQTPFMGCLLTVESKV